MTVGIFFWPGLPPAAILKIQVVEDRALLESNPSTATRYTGSGRLTAALFPKSILVTQSDKLQPAIGGLNVLLSVALQIKMRP